MDDKRKAEEFETEGHRIAFIASTLMESDKVSVALIHEINYALSEARKEGEMEGFKAGFNRGVKEKSDGLQI